MIPNKTLPSKPKFYRLLNGAIVQNTSHRPRVRGAALNQPEVTDPRFNHSRRGVLYRLTHPEVKG